jgi:hypothetical protein
MWRRLGEAKARISNKGGMKQRLLILASFAALVVCGCARERDIMGNPTDGSHRVNTFVVLDGRLQVLWKIAAPAPGVRSGEHIVYGEVPNGFRQEIPTGEARPRPMAQGEPLIVVIVTPEYVYRGECVGDRPTEPRCESWESGPPEKSIIDRALRGEKIGRAP